MKTICWITGINRNYYNLIAKDTPAIKMQQYI